LKPLDQKPKVTTTTTVVATAQTKISNERGASKDKEMNKSVANEDEEKYALALVPVNTTSAAENDTTASTCTDLVVVNTDAAK
jgi:hypothetical protein